MTFIAITGLLLIAVPIAFNATFFLLQRAFEYPDILRKPTDYIYILWSVWLVAFGVTLLPR